MITLPWVSPLLCRSRSRVGTWWYGYVASGSRTKSKRVFRSVAYGSGGYGYAWSRPCSTPRS